MFPSLRKARIHIRLKYRLNISKHFVLDQYIKNSRVFFLPQTIYIVFVEAYVGFGGWSLEI